MRMMNKKVLEIDSSFVPAGIKGFSFSKWPTVIIVFLLLILVVTPVQVKALGNGCNLDFSVDQISYVNNAVKFTSLGCFKSYQEAESFFNVQKNSKNHLVIRSKKMDTNSKILAMDYGYVIISSYPLGYIYADKNLVSGSGTSSTYFQQYSKLYYLGTEINSNGRYVYKVAMSGYVGYVDANSHDLLPLYYLQNELPFILRNNTSYERTSINKYVVKTGSDGIREIFYSSGLASARDNYEIGPFGKAPIWLDNGEYYSYDGITFYTDFQMKNVVASGSKYYNYYQYLPLRTRSNITGAEMDQYLREIGKTNSVYYGKSNEFVINQNKYGMNALLVFALANHESAYGTSSIARNKNNVFGWNAIDSNPYEGADYYANVGQSIREHMSVNLFGYTNIADSRFTSPAYGNKGAGFNTKYASDPDWGVKIAAHAYRVDKRFGFKDLDYYGIGVLDDYSNINVRAQASTSSAVYYTIPGSSNTLKNQTIAITKKVGDFYESTAWYPIIDGRALTYSNKGYYLNNIDTSLAYIHDSFVTLHSNGRWAPLPAGVLPKSALLEIPVTPPEPDPEPEPPAIEEGESGTFKTTDRLNVRSAPSTSNTQIYGVLPVGTEVDGTYVNNNTWIKITYEGKIGYISADYVVKVEEVLTDYRVTPREGLIVRSIPSTSGERLGALVYNTVFQGKPVENGTWIKLTYLGKAGYVSADYVEKVESNPGSQLNIESATGYKLSGTVLTGMNLTTTISSLEQKLQSTDSSITVSVTNSSNAAKSKDSYLATGDTLTISQNGQSTASYSIAVKGDINGDSKITITDYRLIKQHLLNVNSLSGVQSVAGDSSGDGRLTISDYRIIKQDLLNITKIHR